MAMMAGRNRALASDLYEKYDPGALRLDGSDLFTFDLAHEAWNIERENKAAEGKMSTKQRVEAQHARGGQRDLVNFVNETRKTGG